MRNFFLVVARLPPIILGVLFVPIGLLSFEEGVLRTQGISTRQRVGLAGAGLLIVALSALGIVSGLRIREALWARWTCTLLSGALLGTGIATFLGPGTPYEPGWQILAGPMMALPGLIGLICGAATLFWPPLDTDA